MCHWLRRTCRGRRLTRAARQQPRKPDMRRGWSMNAKVLEVLEVRTRVHKLLVHVFSRCAGEGTHHGHADPGSLKQAGLCSSGLPTKPEASLNRAALAKMSYPQSLLLVRVGTRFTTAFSWWLCSMAVHKVPTSPIATSFIIYIMFIIHTDGREAKQAICFISPCAHGYSWPAFACSQRWTRRTQHLGGTAG